MNIDGNASLTDYPTGSKMTMQSMFRSRGTGRTHQRPWQLIHLLPLVSQQNPQVSNLTNQKRNVPQWQVLRFESMPDI